MPGDSGNGSGVMDDGSDDGDFSNKEGGDQKGGSDEGWRRGEGGGDGGWSTSNEIPEVVDLPSPAGSGSVGGDEQTGGGALDEALEDFDGEILAERDAIRERSGSGSVSIPLPRPQGAAGSPGGSATTSAEEDGLPEAPPAANVPPMPPGRNGDGTADLPDARDDDVIARQLREAAMAETDPELKEKLWEEYRRYKGK